MQVDRITKLLLGAIVVLLGVLVVRPMIPVAPQAQAQQQGTNQVELGYRIPPPSTIKLNPEEALREVQVIDGAQAFLLRYDNRIEVYRVQVVSVDGDRLRRK